MRYMKLNLSETRMAFIFCLVFTAMSTLSFSAFAGGTVTTEIYSCPSSVTVGQSVDVQVRIKLEGDDNDGPWQVTNLDLRDDDALGTYQNIRQIDNPMYITSQGSWHYYTFSSVVLSNWDDGGNGIELYVCGEVDDNDLNGYNPYGSSSIIQVRIAYTVALDQQSGAGGSSSVTAIIGQPMPSASAPSRTGYTFQGYYDETGGSGAKYYNANMSSARNWDKTFNTILYAYWTANNYTVTATASNGGTVSPSFQNVAPGDTTTFTVSPAPGYAHSTVSGDAPGGVWNGNIYTTAPIIEIRNLAFSFIVNTEQVKQYYDKNDQILGQSYSSGFAIGYGYDGNGNMTQKILLDEDSNQDGIPDILQFIEGIDFGSTQNYFLDSDGDGWTDYQEIKTQSDPNSSSQQPWLAGQSGNVLEAMDMISGISASEFVFNFRPTRYVMATGDLDGITGDEIVFSADGDTGSYENYVYILTQTLSSWTTQKVSVGDSAVTSIAIGDPGTGKKAIYAGLRNPVQYGSIIKIESNNGSWDKATLSASTDQSGYVLGIRDKVDVIVSLKTQSGLAGQTYTLSPSEPSWKMTPYDDNAGSVEGATVIPTDLGVKASSGATVRLLNGNIHIKNMPVSQLLDKDLAVCYSFDGNAHDSTAEMRDGVVTGAVLANDRNGTANSTYYFNNADGSDNITIYDGGELSFDITKEDYSISLWVCPNGTGSIIADTVENPYEGYSYNIYIDSSNNTVHAKAWNLVQECDLFDPSPVTPEQWLYITLTAQNKVLYLYINGQLKAQDEIANFSTKNKGNLVIGSGFTGKIDEIKIYNRALSPTEVALLSESDSFEMIIPDFIPADQIVPNSQYFALSSVPAQEAVQDDPNYYYVSPTNLTPPSGRQWSGVYQSIQSAINAAQDGDVIMADNGTYSPITIDKELTIKSINGPDLAIIDGLQAGRCVDILKQAKLDGFTVQNGKAAIYQIQGTQTYEARGAGVYMHDSGTLVNCIIKNCNISGFNSTKAANGYGAGVYLENGGHVKSCIIENCTMSSEATQYHFYYYGAGLYSQKGGIIEDCTIRANILSGPALQDGTISFIGGGLYFGNGGLIQRCSIRNNSFSGTFSGTSRGYGTGVYASQFVKIIGSTIENNIMNLQTDDSAKGEGAGVWNCDLEKCTVNNNRINATADSANFSRGGGVCGSKLINCILSNNSIVAYSEGTPQCEAYGGGAYGSTLTNCVVANNNVSTTSIESLARSYGGGVYNGTIYNSIIYGNSATTHVWGEHAYATGGIHDATVDYCLVYNNTASGNYEVYPNCNPTCQIKVAISEDPLFVDYANNNFHLQTGSPCIDFGLNGYVSIDTDLENNKRLYNSIVDLGSYEYGSEPIEEVDVPIPAQNPDTTSLLHYLRVRDADDSNDISIHDEPIYTLYQLNENSWSQIYSASKNIERSDVDDGYAMCSFVPNDQSGQYTYIAQPDGRIYTKQYVGNSLSDPNITESLFSGQYAGQMWYGLNSLNSINGLPLLAGLIESPESPDRCNIIFWDSLTQSVQGTDAEPSDFQTAPTTEISSSITSGGRIARIEITTSDHEGNACLPIIHYRIGPAGEWHNATINAIDGQMYNGNTHIIADPNGSTHTVLWDSQADLGPGFTGTVEIRVQAQDVSLIGQWSSSIQYHVDTDNLTGLLILQIITSIGRVNNSQNTIQLSGTANENVIGSIWGVNTRNGFQFTIPAQLSWNTSYIPLEQGYNKIIIYGKNADGFTVSDIITIYRDRYNVPELTINPIAGIVYGNTISLTGTSNENVVDIQVINTTNNDQHIFSSSSIWTSPSIQLSLGANVVRLFAYNSSGDYAVYEIVIQTGNTIWYVNKQNLNMAPNGSPENPYSLIQDAINRSLKGDEIHVAAGQYDENIIINHDLTLLGGYSINDWNLSRESVSEPTIIHGQSGTVVSITDSNVNIDKFTITGGINDSLGAGIYATASTPDMKQVKITNCRIQDNVISSSERKTLAGAGLYASGNIELQMIENIIKFNEIVSSYAPTGGFGTQPVILPPNGAGISCLTDNQSLFVNNLIVSNRITILGTLIPYGAGIYAKNSHLSNNTIADNVNPQGISNGAGIYVENSTVDNSILWGNTPDQIDGHECSDISYSDVQGNICTGVNGNISIDPLFVDSSSGDYHLQSLGGRWNPIHIIPNSNNIGAWITDFQTSPCIDAGDPNTSFYSESFPNGNKINMGAYGGTSKASRTYLSSTIKEDFDKSQSVDIADLAMFSAYWLENIPIGSNELPYDLTNNGIVNLDDYSQLASNWMGRLYQLTTDTKGPGEIFPDGGYYAPDTTVRLQALDNIVYSWSGTDDDDSTGTINNVTMNTDKSVNLTFDYDIKMNYTNEVAGDWTGLYAVNNEPAYIDGSVGLTGYQYILSEINESIDYRVNANIHLYGEDAYEWGDPDWYLVSCGKAYGQINGSFTSGKYFEGTAYKIELSVAITGIKSADVVENYYAAIRNSSNQIIADIYPGKPYAAAMVVSGDEYQIEIYAEENDTAVTCGDCGASYDRTLQISVIEDPDITWVSINDSGAGMKDGGGNPISQDGFSGYMSKYETTNAQYCQFLNAAVASNEIGFSGSYVIGTSGSYSGQNYYNLAGSGYTGNGANNGGAARINWTGSSFTVATGFENHPVTQVSWYGATAFASFYGWRLPTEWEWQAVADYDSSYRYGCGTAINNSIANYYTSAHPHGTTTVGQFGIYGYRMCDMAGNVWEWTSTESAGYRIIRGGCWNGVESGCAVSDRGGNLATNATNYFMGFRVCR